MARLPPEPPADLGPWMPFRRWWIERSAKVRARQEAETQAKPEAPDDQPAA